MSGKLSVFMEETHRICKLLKIGINKLKLFECLKDELSDYSHISTNLILRTLLILLVDLKSHGEYTILEDIISHETRSSASLRSRYQHLQAIHDRDEELKQIINQKTAILRENRIENNKIVEEQARNLSRTTFQHTSDISFEKRLLQVRVEENNLKYEIMEEELKLHIADIKQDFNIEAKVHLEIMWYYNNEKEETEKEILLYRRKFSNINEKKTELEICSQKQRNLREKLEEQKCEYNKRRLEMDAYLINKTRRRKEQQHEEFLNQKATVIQAWWRGMMIRKYLVPYNYLKAMHTRKRKCSLKKRGK